MVQSKYEQAGYTASEEAFSYLGKSLKWKNPIPVGKWGE
jgi:hypothetical protein